MNEYIIWISDKHKSIGPIYASCMDIFECDIGLKTSLESIIDYEISIVDPNGAVLIPFAFITRIRQEGSFSTRLIIEIKRMKKY